MGDAVQPSPSYRIGEDDLGEPLAIEASIRLDHRGAERGKDGSQCRLTRLDDLAGELISVDYVSAKLGEHRGDGRFSRADAARQAQDFHQHVR